MMTTKKRRKKMKNKLVILDIAFAHAKEVFKQTGKLNVSFESYDDKDNWEFIVDEFYMIEADTPGCSFDIKSLPDEDNHAKEKETKE